MERPIFIDKVLKRRRINMKVAYERVSTSQQSMADTEMFAITGDGYTVTWNEVSSTRIDTTAMKHDMPDIAAQENE